MLNQKKMLNEIVPVYFISNVLCYRLMTKDDAEAVVRLRNAEHVRKNYIYQKQITVEEHNNYFNTKIETGIVVQYIMKEKNEDKAIGCTFLKDIDLAGNTAEFGVFIGDETALGKGYGRDAVNQMKRLAFEVIGLNKLTLRVLGYNTIALRTYKNAGFIEVERIVDESELDKPKREIIIMEISNKRYML